MNRSCIHHVTFRFPIKDPDKFEVVSTSMSETGWIDLVETYLQNSIGAGADTREANELDVYTISLRVDMSCDHITVRDDCGNLGLVFGILADILNHQDKRSKCSKPLLEKPPEIVEDAPESPPEVSSDSEVKNRAINGLLDSLDLLMGERDKARKQLLASRGPQTLTCAYCGQEYPPDTPASQHQLLTSHGQQCKSHPIRVDLIHLLDMFSHPDTRSTKVMVRLLKVKYHYQGAH